MRVRPVLPHALAAVLAGASGAAVAQETGAVGRPAVLVVPSLSVSTTVSDHYRAAGSDGGSENITRVSPGIRIDGQTARLKGVVDYGLVGTLYGNNSSNSDLQHRLSSSGIAELVPQHFSVSASASITRVPRSAFGFQTTDPLLDEANQTQVRTYSLQPVLRGTFGGLVNAQLAGSARGTDGGQIGSRSTGASASVSSASAGRLGWAVDASRDIVRYEGARENTNDRAIVTLLYTPMSELQLRLRGGAERSDAGGLEARTYDNWGGGLSWTPGPRTRLTLDGDRRYFGNSHTLSFEHRMRRSVWRISDSRAASNGSGASGGTVTAYDLFFQLFASQEPDPVARDLLVRSFLERNGVPPDTLIGGGGFLTSAASVQRRQELSFALTGVRTSLLASAYVTDNSRIDAASSGVDDLALGDVRQRGLSFTISHRLTPLSGLSLTLSSQRSRLRADDPAAGRRSGLDSVQLGWNTQLGPASNLALSVRHNEFQDDTDPHTENALTAAFSTRF